MQPRSLLVLAALGMLSQAASALYVTQSAFSDWTVPGEPSGVVTRMDEHGYVARAIQHTRTTADLPQAPVLAPDNWQGLGPFGGDIADVQASPQNASIVLAGLAPASGGGGGLYRSTDAGATWTAVAQLNNLQVQDIEFAPNGNAYIGTIDGVWRSSDGGATWTPGSMGIGLNDQVMDVHIDPVNAMRIWAGIADAIGSQPVNVMLSVDGGVTWTNKTPPLGAAQSCNAIAIDPLDPNRVLCGFGGAFGGGQAWFTPDGGTTWFNRSAGLPNRPVMDVVYSGGNVLIGGGQLFGSQTFGLFTSPDHGVTWTPLHNGTWPLLVVQDIGIDPNNASIIYTASPGQGLFRSIDGGANWSFGVGGTGSLSVNAVSFSPGSSSIIYTGSASFAIWKSTNSGVSFAPSSVGIGALDVFSVGANPNNASELAICFQGLNNGGVYTSTNGGTTWTPENVPGTRWNQVKFSPAGVLYAISDGPTGIAQEALYQRSGTTWTPIGPFQGPLFESELFGMVVSANNPGLIVAVGADFGVAGFEPTVWHTPDGGANWTKVYEGATTNLPLQDVWLVDPATDTTFVAPYTDFNGPQQGGVLRSTNGGTTWGPSSTGLPTTFQGFSISGSASVQNTLYVSNSVFGAGTQGVFKSLDGGASWAATGHLGPVVEVLTDASDPQILYIAPQGGSVRVMASTNDGASFSNYDNGLAGAGFVRDLRRSTTSLLLATSTGTFSNVVASPFTPYCFGDGSGAACPCGNNSPVGAGAGCLHSFGQGGKLIASGSASVASDTVLLTGTNLPPSTTILFFQGTLQTAGAAGAVFGDGLRCASGTVIRLGTEIVTGGTASYPGVGDQIVSVRGQIPLAGATRHYQGWYRNQATFCTMAVFNLTNGLTIPWTP